MRCAELDSSERTSGIWRLEGGGAGFDPFDLDSDEPDDDGDRDTEPFLPVAPWLELDEELALALADELLRRFGAR
ncbi:MAG: hypothetical protein U0271_30550 [Polyangiaceae bacterium]